jgi:hypothetical protein
MTKIMEQFRSVPYKVWLWPGRSTWEGFAPLAISLVDFKLIRLPNWLFWLYLPLRPFLFAWRHVRVFSHGSSGDAHVQVDTGPRTEDARAPVAQGAHEN